MQLSQRRHRAGHGPRFNRKALAIAFTALLLLVVLSLIWSQTPLTRYANPDALSALMERFVNDPLAFFWVIGIYVLLTPIFFPMTLLTGAVILAFGGLKGFAFSMAGSLASGIVAYYMGQSLGRKRFEKLAPSTSKAMQGVRDNSIIGIVVLRTLPVAPYTLTNVAFGVVAIPLLNFLVGTLLGLLPGKAFMAFFGTSLIESWRDPDLANLGQAALLFAAWVAVIMICTKFARKWQKTHGSAAG